MRAVAVLLAILAGFAVSSAQQPCVSRHGELIPQASMQALPFTAVDPGTRTLDATFRVVSSPFIAPKDRFSENPRLSRMDAKVRAALELDPTGWLDTHILVIPGDRINVTAIGTMQLPDGRTVTPDGVPRGWKDLLRLFPDNSANAGALIARVGNSDVSVPFVVGSFREVVIHEAGELLLRINLSQDLEAEGSYAVKMHFDVQGTPATAETPALVLNPNIFNRLPRHVTDLQGRPGDMVNFALLGTREQVKQAFDAAGWVQVDRTKKGAVIHGVESTIRKDPYLEMPMSILYLFSRPQDLSYARANPIAVAAVRHHLRVWDSGLVVNGVPLWVGSATHDIGFERDQRNDLVTHKIDPDIDRERDYILATFQAAGDVTAAAYVTPGNPLREARTATGGSFYSDGRIVVMELR